MDVNPALPFPANGDHPCSEGFIQLHKTTNSVAGAQPEKGVNPLWAIKTSAKQSCQER